MRKLEKWEEERKDGTKEAFKIFVSPQNMPASVYPRPNPKSSSNIE